MTSESEKRAHLKYIKNLRGQGIRQHAFRCTDEQYLLLKGFFSIIRKMENLENLVALDVSDNGHEFKLIFDDNAENLTSE